MCLEEVYSNPDKSLETNRKLSEANENLEELYEEWEELI
jgi:ATP-binding cassette subfamily F protein 3